MKSKDLQEDLDKCYVSPDAVEVAWGLLTTNKASKIKKLNSKKKVSQVKSNEFNNVRKRLNLPVVEVKVRNCLTCRIDFESEGKQNRICNDCRKENNF